MICGPAYDLINGNLLNPKDNEDLAMTLNGRKRKITRRDFIAAANTLKIPEATVKRVFNKFASHNAKVFKLIDQSYMSEEYKEEYKCIWSSKLSCLDN